MVKRGVEGEVVVLFEDFSTLHVDTASLKPISAVGLRTSGGGVGNYKADVDVWQGFMKLGSSMAKTLLFSCSLFDQIFQGTSYNDSVAKVWSLTHPEISLQPEGTVVKSLVAVEINIFPPGEEPLMVLYMEKVCPCFS